MGLEQLVGDAVVPRFVGFTVAERLQVGWAAADGALRKYVDLDAVEVDFDVASTTLDAAGVWLRDNRATVEQALQSGDVSNALLAMPANEAANMLVAQFIVATRAAGAHLSGGMKVSEAEQAKDAYRLLQFFEVLLILDEKGTLTSIFTGATSASAQVRGSLGRLAGLGGGAAAAIAPIITAVPPWLIVIVIAIALLAVVWVIMYAPQMTAKAVAYNDACKEALESAKQGQRNKLAEDLCRMFSRQDPTAEALNNAVWVVGGVAAAYLFMVYGLPSLIARRA